MKQLVLVMFLCINLVVGTLLPAGSQVNALELNTQYVHPPKVNKMTDQERSVTGQGLAHAMIVVVIGKDVYRDNADRFGKFSVDISYRRPVGTKIDVYQTDHQIPSSPTTVYVEAGQTSRPTPPKVAPIYEGDQEVSGTADANTTIKVTIKGKLYTRSADRLGDFHVPIDRYPSGTEIQVVSERNGQESFPVTVYILANEQTQLKMPKLDPVTEQDKQIRGNADPNVNIWLTIRGDDYATPTNSNGDFMIILDHTYNVGSEITVYSFDGVNRQSPTLHTKVIQGQLEVGIDYVTSIDTQVDGWAPRGSLIDLQVGNRVYQDAADGLGRYHFNLAKTYDANTKIHVTATDPFTGNKAESETVVYPRAPAIYTVLPGSAIIQGIADPYGQITVRFSSTPFPFFGQADAAGNYHVPVVDSVTLRGVTVYVSQVKNSLTSRESSLLIN